MTASAAAATSAAARVAVVVAVVVGAIGAASLGALALLVFGLAIAVATVLLLAGRGAAQSALSEREERYRTIFDRARQLVFEVDAQGRWAYLGPSYTEVLGLSPAPRIGEPCIDALPADALPVLTAAWNTLQSAEPGVVTGDMRYVDDDGRERVVEWFAVPQRDRGRGTGVVGTLQDVTALRHQQELAAQAEHREQTVIDALPDGVLIYDDRGVVVRANPRAQEVAGGRDQVGQVAGRQSRFPLVDINGDPFPREHSPAVRALRTGEPVEDEVIGIERPTGRSWIRVSARRLPAWGDRPGGIVVTTRDVTEAVQQLEELDRARGEAERANQAKTEFMSRLHHELRTPLNAVYTAAQLLDERELPEAERRIAARILKGCRLAIGLMEDLREISLIEDGRMRLRHDAVDVVDAVATALASVEHLAARSDVRLQVAPIDPGLRVWADAKRLAQVLVNLLTNAVKYNRPAGRVDVLVTADGTRLRIQVADSGRGIPADDLERVFEPFERLDAARTGVEGTGLGLSISRRLVDTMDGHLSVTSEVGVGTTFTVDLAQAPSVAVPGSVPVQVPLASEPPPVAPPPAPAAPAAPAAEAPMAPAPPTPREGITSTVLYIEDNPDNVELMQDVFQRWPTVDVQVAMTGAEGLARAEELHPALILLDLHLPDLHGLQVLEGLRERPSTAAIPVVMVTADATGWEHEVPAARRPEAIVTKPLDVKAFTRVLADWLEPTRR